MYPIYNCGRYFNFAEGNEKNVRVLKVSIQYFELVSGLKVNWAKSHLLGLSLSESAYSHLANVIGLL